MPGTGVFEMIGERSPVMSTIPPHWRSIFSRRPVGWTRRSRRRIQQALEDADRYVQDLNDRFTNPSGENLAEVQQAPAAAEKKTHPEEVQQAPKRNPAG